MTVLLAAVLAACGDGNSDANDNASNQDDQASNTNNASTDSSYNTEPDENNQATENNDSINDDNSNDVVEENNNQENSDQENNDEQTAEADTEPMYEMDGPTVRPIDDADAEVVLLTIDDAPDNHGPEMASILQELDAGAIFFVNGHFIQSDEGKEQLQEIYDMGFEIGNHTMNHPNLSDLSEEEQYEEIVALNDLIEEVIGERPRFFRAPFGVNTDYSKELMEEEDMQWMNWTYGYDFDPDYMEKEALETIMVETELLTNGANLLMHDREFTMEALEGIVEGLREKGYEIVDPASIK